jgi:hypothetical protein
MVGIVRIKFDCCRLGTASDDDNGNLIEIYSKKFQYLKSCISRTECRFVTKKKCRVQWLGVLFFVRTYLYYLRTFYVQKKFWKYEKAQNPVMAVPIIVGLVQIYVQY